MNLSKVRPGTCTRAFVVTGWRVFQTFCIICLALSSVALLSIGRRGVFSSHILLICPSRFVSAQLLVFFLFYKVCCPKHWPFGKISRDLLRNWGFLFDCMCMTFSEEAPNLSGDLLTDSAWAGLSVLSDFLQGFPLLTSGCCIHPLFSGGGLVGFSSLDSLRDRVSKVLGRIDLWLQAISW